MLRFEDARQLVIQEAGRQGSAKTTTKNVWEALGFVLAQEIRTDRAYPPFDRATRDGYAVRASEAVAGATIGCLGEIKAGDTVTAPLAARSCVQIMTGSAVPGGADAVVMIEFTLRDGDAVTFQRDSKPGQNIVRQGSEAAAGALALGKGKRLGFAELALAAQGGAGEFQCGKKPGGPIFY